MEADAGVKQEVLELVPQQAPFRFINRHKPLPLVVVQ